MLKTPIPLPASRLPRPLPQPPFHHPFAEAPAAGRIPRQRPRHVGADGLRVLALLGVTAFHLRPDLVPSGFLGVVIFFVLAGFYTTRSFVVHPQVDLASFYTRRFLRLLPSLLFLIALITLYSGFFLPELFPFLKRSAGPSLGAYQNIAQVLANQSYFNRHGAFDPLIHLWALSLEMQFYFLYPFFYMALSGTADRLSSRLRPYGRELAAAVLLLFSVGSALWLALAYSPSADPTPIYYSPLCRMHSFLIGAAANLWIAGRQMRHAFSHQPSSPVPRFLRTSAAWISFLLMLAAFFVFPFNSAFLYRGGFFLYSCLAVIFLYFGGVKPVPGMGFMASFPIRWLASRSYPLYLWQYALMILVEAGLRFSTLGFWPRLALQLIPLLLLAELSWRLFEQPGKVRRPALLMFSFLLGALCLIMLMSPPPVAPKAPALQGSQVEAAIEANRERNVSLQAVTSPPAATSAATILPTPAATPSTVTTTPAPTYPPVPDEENPYGYSAEACYTLRPLRVTAIGDSVLAMAMTGLQVYIPDVYIDAEVSRHFIAGPAILQSLDQLGQPCDVIVVALATNGDLQEDTLSIYHDIANGRPLIFVNTVVPGTWERPNNEKLSRFAAQHDNVTIADWYQAAKNHPEYFYQDATHPIPSGADVYDDVILRAILNALNVKPD